jgi:two-component system, chemotaxis family, CheB/CheR fusion protein
MPDAVPAATRQRRAEPIDFPVVGIGASAGGLPAVTELLSALPPAPGMALVFVSHLSPDHESTLDRLLSKATHMPVRQAHDGDRVQRDHVYVCPPGRDLSIHDGVLRTSSPSALLVVPATIDHFFASLARDQHVRARGVLLSGAGADGSEGLQLIRLAGGVAFVQDPASARFDAMPRNAIASGAADIVLKPAAIARKLVEIGNTRIEPDTSSASASSGPDSPLYAILELVRRASGIDLRHYKQATLQRRIARRMAVRGCAGAGDYLRQLRADPQEVKALQGDLLIHVSSFMRDADAFRALRKQVLVCLATRGADKGPIRVWVPGCARGEEVYTIGMLLLESLVEVKRKPRIQLFGTDISGPEIEAARAARFPRKALTGLDPKLRARYFEKLPEGYRVSRELRSLCVFAVQEVGSDPPFSNIDLISCRNMLIYFTRPLQRRVIQMFHYALKPGGSLFLGRSESLTGHTDLFGALDAKHRIFRRKELPKNAAMHWAAPPRRTAPSAAVLPAPMSVPAQDLAHHIQQLMQERYAPAGFYIDEDMEILAFVGDVSPYVQPAPGQANLQLTRMLPASMALDLRTVVRAARKAKRTVARETNWVAPSGQSMPLSLVATRAAAGDGNPPGYIVLLERVTASDHPADEATKKPRQRAEIARLNKQLVATREQLQTVIEEQERTAEELRAANEEALSSNEELQSNNEELETAKEELQSANEELATLNEELQNRNQELDLLASELSSLIAGVNIPIVHLDSKGRVHRFSPAAQTAFNLITTDIGRPFAQIKPTFKLPDLDNLIAMALGRGTPSDREVQDPVGR